MGGTTFNLSSGQTTTLIVRLNLTGRRLLSKYYRLPADLAISGTTGLSQQVTFAYPRVRSAVTWTWSYKGVRTQVEQLIVKHIPKGGHVILLCHGGGCRSSHNSFTPQHGDAVALASAVSKSGTLTAGAKLRITISAPNSVAKVLDITTRANNYPKVVEACQPPGASHPSACA